MRKPEMQIKHFLNFYGENVPPPKKKKCASIKILKTAVTSGTVNFNFGIIGLSDIFDDTEMTPGQYLYTGATRRDSVRKTKQKLNDLNTEVQRQLDLLKMVL